MQNEDFLQRFIINHGQVRGEILCLTKTYNDILLQHPYPPAIKKLLGEALCIAGLLSVMIKNLGRVSVQFQSDTDLSLLLAQCDKELNLRGLAKWKSEIDEIDLSQLLQKGLLVITTDLGNHPKPYQGIVAWEGKSLAKSVENYFQASEQIPTKIWITATEERIIGYLLQVIPRSDPQSIDMQQWESIVNASECIDLNKFRLDTIENCLSQIYPDTDIELFAKQEAKFQCTCNRERCENAIALLGPQEVEEELKAKHVLTINCEFCNKEFIFTRAEVEEIFLSKLKPNLH